MLKTYLINNLTFNLSSNSIAKIYDCFNCLFSTRLQFHRLKKKLMLSRQLHLMIWFRLRSLSNLTLKLIDMRKW